jgi:Ca2+-transporting ATPase
MDPLIIPVHTKVSGRARFKIKPLVRSPRLRQWVDTEVQRMPGVRRVKISSVTGSLLVFFDLEQDWRAIAARIARVIEKAPCADPKTVQHAVGPRVQGAENLPTSLVDKSVVSLKWHQLEADQVLARFGTSTEQGLAPEAADHRIQIHGFNVVHAARLRKRTETFKDQFMFLPIGLLLAESVVALFGGAVIEAALLSIILAVNVTVGYLIDRRAEQTIAAFKRRPQPPSLVLRGGSWINLPGDELVVGDILKLVPGTYVGADGRILDASHLKIDESILTGESNPVEKQADTIHHRATPVFDQRNMAFLGTLVVGGEGLAVVVATGPMTEYGKLNALFDETIPPQTPVIGKIHALSRALLKVALGMSLGVSLIGLLQGRSLLQAIGRAFSIAAAGIPAGLPSAATVNMALGFKRLQRENVSIRRLYSLESLSAVQMICFDKTGTLTRSRISVQQIYCSRRDIRVYQRAFWISQKPVDLLGDPDFRRLLQACVLCAESKTQVNTKTGQRQISGSPTEVALLHLAIMTGFDLEGSYRRYSLQKVRHRGDFQRYMMTVHAAPGGRTTIFVKGDPSEVLQMCTWELRGGRRQKLSEAAESRIEIQNQRMAGEALRVLGFAYSNLVSPPDDSVPLRDLTWIGLVGMAEPIRQGVVSLIDQMHQGGIQTVMITGDQSTTAESVARQIGLCGNSAIRIFDSSRFDALTPELASALIRDVQVFARVNPAQKLQIIQAYQNRGMVVAMTGDGINDGPALRAADVGIAMGLSGTHAAREVADMVLERDNITSVNTAILEGRAAYRNLKRALRYFVATHFSDMLLTTAGSTITPSAAMLAFRPVQLDLFTNLTPGLALLMEPASPNIGREPPRDREEPLFSSRDMLALFSESAVLTGGALAAFTYGVMRYGPGSRAATLAYESLSASKVLHALTCRPLAPDSSNTDRKPANPQLTAALFAALVTQAGTMLIPGLRRLLNIAPLNPVDLIMVGLTALTTHSINRTVREERIETKA